MSRPKCVCLVLDIVGDLEERRERLCTSHPKQEPSPAKDDIDDIFGLEIAVCKLVVRCAQLRGLTSRL